MSLSDLNAALALIVQQDYERLIVITQRANLQIAPKHGINYLINLDCKQKQVSYGQWVRVDGIADTVVSFICNYEQANSAF